MTWTQSPAGTNWSAWSSLAGDMVDVEAVSSDPNRLDVFARHRDLSIRHKYWDGGSQWLP